MTKYVDTRPGREGVEIGSVPSTVPQSTGAGEPEGPTPTDLANAIGAKADSEQQANESKLGKHQTEGANL